MKSRRIKHDTYNTLMINYSKIKKIVNDDKKVVFIFNCLDGYYYVEDGCLCYSCQDYQEDISVEDLCDLTVGQYNELVEKLNKHMNTVFSSAF